MSENLIERLRASFARHRDKTALEVAGETYTYGDLSEKAECCAAALGATNTRDEQFTAILAQRSSAAYVGILGALLAGKAYLPVSPGFPARRSLGMLDQAGCSTLVLGEEAIDSFRELVGNISKTLTVYCISRSEKLTQLAEEVGSDHAFVFIDEMPFTTPSPNSAGRNDPAYLLFTSGSTGEPKGVVVSHGNVCTYVEHVTRIFDVKSDDRLSQMFELTFDLSAHDMFVSWLTGACLCVPGKASQLLPGKFIRDNRLTMWFSVPSVINYMNRFNTLEPGSLPNLRHSLFCGEPLTLGLAMAWQSAAPNSTVYNLYGITETTIANTAYLCNEATLEEEAVNGVIPIGKPFMDNIAIIVDESGELVADGEPGECLLSGPQLAAGYLNDPEKTKEKFIRRTDSPDKTWYRTGDRVVRDNNGNLAFVGRIDNQVQIRGHRVELGEIEHLLREAAGVEMAVAVAWPAGEGEISQSIHAFLPREVESERDEIRRKCTLDMPSYMVPDEFIFLAEFPYNASGKVDRRALVETLGGEVGNDGK